MDPVEKFLKVKTAGFGDSARQLGGEALKSFSGGMGAGVVAAGATGMAYGAKTLYDAITKRQDFKTMLEVNPDLQEHFEKDPKFFNQAYSSLRSVNAQYSKEPLIAGNYMRQMMDSPLTAGGKIELAMQGGQHNSNPILEAFGKGALEGSKPPKEQGGGGRSGGGGSSPARRHP